METSECSVANDGDSGIKHLNEGNSSENQSDKTILDIGKVTNSLDQMNLKTSSLSNGLPHAAENDEIEYISYKSELQMPDIMRLIQKDLSEPYSIYTYRYFIHNWPKLCFLVRKLLNWGY